MLWAEETLAGLRNAERTSPISIELWIEMMDMKRLPARERFETLKNIYQAKYQDIDVDLVLTVDDDALRFALEVRDELWPDKPIVFCGVNYYDATLLAGHERVTGVVESIDLYNTIELATKLFPEARTLHVVNDLGSTGRANKLALESVRDAFSSRLTFHYLEDWRMDELQDQLDSLPDTEPVLMLSFNLDRSGQTFTYKESIRLIGPHIHGPMFGVWHFYMNRGLLGGYLLSGERHGEEALGLAIQILQGVPIGELPVVEHLPSELVLDYTEFLRFGISDEELPPEVTWINRNPTFYESHSSLVHTVTIAFCVLMIVIIALIANIHWRQKAESLLRKSERLYRLLADNMADVVFVLDQDLRLTYISPSIERLKAMTPDQALQTGFFSLFPEADRQRLRQSLQGELQKQGNQPEPHASRCLEVPLHGEGNNIYWTEMRVTALMDENHDLSGLLGVIQDVSQRKEAEKAKHRVEAQLRQQQKLESIGTLASGVAHEINNPINIIMNFGELIQRRYDGERQDVQQYATEIIRESRRIAGIVHNLLTFSRQEQEHHQVSDMADIIQDTLSLMNKILEKDQIQRTVEIPKELPKISCKKQQMMQVLMNLLTNARDALNERYPAHDPQKRVHIAVRTWQEDNRVWLRTTVEDFGSGIEDAIKDQIFDPFFTSKGRAKGTGLGLSVSHGIVLDHGGRLSVESQVEQFTRFHMDLPIVE